MKSVLVEHFDSINFPKIGHCIILDCGRMSIYVCMGVCVCVRVCVYVCVCVCVYSYTGGRSADAIIKFINEKAGKTSIIVHCHCV